MERPLTPGEVALARTMFGEAIAYDRPRIVRRKWFPFQPDDTVMAPTGDIHFPPANPHYHADFSGAPILDRALLVHELVHVWQAQTRGRWWLPTHRHPWCRYAYRLEPGRPFARYGIEQQAQMVEHAYLMRNGMRPLHAPPLGDLEKVLPFRGTTVA